jgi:hypothetical protein
LSGYFAVCKSGIGGPANEFLKLKNIFAFAIASDAGKYLWKNLHAISDYSACQLHGPRSTQQKAQNIFGGSRAIGADDRNFF